MSSETMSGKDFMSKNPNPGVNSQWTFFEELMLVLNIIKNHKNQKS